MFYYLVDKIGDGSKSNPFRPNYEGSFVGLIINDKFLIGINEDVPELNKIDDLETFCNDNQLNYANVLTWFVGD
jgi:hypothetical protein